MTGPNRRWLVTADLHANHRHRGSLLDEFFEGIHSVEHDGVIVVGDTAVFDGPWIEETLKRFRGQGPRLFVPGNHELWSKTTPVAEILGGKLRTRVERAGWHYLPGNAFVEGDVAVVGSLGWYDYAFALAELGIPREFYAAHVAPGSALSGDDAALAALARTLPVSARLYARWNDRRLSVEMPDDETMLREQLNQLQEDLVRVAGAKRVIAAVHVVPCWELMPPRVTHLLDFARAFLGSPKIGEILQSDERVRAVVCGHSHWPVRWRSRPGVDWINVGSGYREKRWEAITV